MPLQDYILVCFLRFATDSCSIWDWLPIDSYIFTKMAKEDFKHENKSYNIQLKKKTTVISEAFLMSGYRKVCGFFFLPIGPMMQGAQIWCSVPT